MKNALCHGVVAVFCICGAYFGAAGVADEIRSARAEIASNSVGRIPRRGICRYYNAWFVDNCTAEERDAILERNIAAHRRWIELAPGEPAAHADLGAVYAAVGRWKEAKAELEAAIAAGDKLSLKRLALSRWELAGCLWRDGDRDGAMKLVREVAAMDGGSVSQGDGAQIRARFLVMALDGNDDDLDAFRLPHSVDGRPFPTPQEATYGEGRVSLARVELKVKGMRDERDMRDERSHVSRDPHVSQDPIIRLLRKKLTRFGSTFAPGGTLVVIEISPDAPVGKPQGYSIDVARGEVSIKARDRLGALWGVVSFIQCIDRGGLTIGECAIRDWPKCERRGVIAYWLPDFLEYALFNKMSTVTFQMGREWVLSPLDKECYRLFARRMRDFGIETYYTIRDIAMQPILPLSSPRTWRLHLATARFYASIGAGVSFNFDDHRFPVHPADIEAAGTVANLDAKYLTRLYCEVKKDYPDFKMQFCPPFYFGPDGGLRKDGGYSEPREPYLKSLGDFLDKEIDVYWTGPRVKTKRITDEKTKWYADLIGRKPSLFHNGNAIGQHEYIQYGADPTGYKESHSRNIFDTIASFQQNTSRYAEAGEVGSAMDWCWNPDAHDGTDSVKRAVDQLEGPGVFEIVAKATPNISYFDKYQYHEPRAELLGEDQAELDRRIAEADTAWKEVLSTAKNGGVFVGGFNRALGWAREQTECRRNPPKKLLEKRDAEMANTKFAVEEVGYDESKGDQFVPAALMHGGTYIAASTDWSKKGPRGVKYVHVGEEVSMKFDCRLFPPEAPPRLIIVGAAFDKDKKPMIEVEVNGQVVWRGEAFRPYYYAPHEIELPVSAIQRSNKLVIRNAAPAEDTARLPKIHYVVIRRE